MCRIIQPEHTSRRYPLWYDAAGPADLHARDRPKGRLELLPPLAPPYSRWARDGSGGVVPGGARHRRSETADLHLVALKESFLQLLAGCWGAIETVTCLSPRLKNGSMELEQDSHLIPIAEYYQILSKGCRPKVRRKLETGKHRMKRILKQSFHGRV
jgi:hypothetical protein